jgi:AraC family transcriptional regulator
VVYLSADTVDVRCGCISAQACRERTSGALSSRGHRIAEAPESRANGTRFCNDLREIVAGPAKKRSGLARHSTAMHGRSCQPRQFITQFMVRDDAFKLGRAMRRIYPNIEPSRSLNGNDLKAELFVFRRLDATDLEFSSTSHLIITLPDGVSGLCECNSGDHLEQFDSMAPNSIIFIPAQKYLRLRITNTESQWRALLLTIEPTVLRQLGEDYIEQLNDELNTQIGVDDPTARQALAAIQEEIENQSAHSALYVETFLVLTLIRLLKFKLNGIPQLPHEYIRGGLASWRLKRALQLIENNGSKIPALSEIASAVNLHEASFCRAFKQSTGLSPHHYLLVHRINRAKEMMRDPTRTLTDIAFDCGFSSSSQFSVVFKRIVGRPPRQYRRCL